MREIKENKRKAERKRGIGELMELSRLQGKLLAEGLHNVSNLILMIREMKRMTEVPHSLRPHRSPEKLSVTSWWYGISSMDRRSFFH